MLLEMAVADAFGGCFEYASRDYVDEHNVLGPGGYPGRRSKDGVGRYTDDTQMSIAIAEAMCSGEKWTRRLVAGKFVEAYKRDPRLGYARRFQKFLDDVSDADEFLLRINPNSDKSGAAMRATPLGLVGDLDKALGACALQASVTHNTVDGINAALASTAMAHYFAHDVGPKDELGRYLESVVDGQWASPWLEPVGAKGWMSVRAAITAIQDTDKLSDLLWRCVHFGGDVDTVATMAVAAASMSHEMGQDLPQALVDSLENGEYGRDYLLSLDTKLKVSHQAIY